MKINEKGTEIILDLNEILGTCQKELSPEQFEDIMKVFSTGDKVFEYIVDKLAYAFSRENYNSFINIGREEFLKRIKQEQLAFYAAKIANKIESFKRNDTDYWKLYQLVVTHAPELIGKIPKMEAIDFDYIHKLEQMIIETFKETDKMVDQKIIEVLDEEEEEEDENN
jgi:hypothetical protein